MNAPPDLRRGLTLHERALHGALNLALPAMRRQRDTLLEVGCIVIDGAPDLSTLEPDVAPEVAELEAAIAAAEEALGPAAVRKGAVDV